MPETAPPSSTKSVHHLRIYGAPGCRVSFKIRDFLKRSAIEFEWTELQSNDEARKLPGIGSLDDERLPVCELPNGARLYRSVKWPKDWDSSQRRNLRNTIFPSTSCQIISIVRFWRKQR